VLRRYAPLIVSVGLIVALGAVGLLASAGAHNKAEELHRRDREALQQTLAGLGNQYLLFALKSQMDFASTGPWSLRPNDPRDIARMQGFVTHSQVLNHGAALVGLDRRPISSFAVDNGELPPQSDPGYQPMVQALRSNSLACRR
jgi:hypothetical protein